METYSVDNQDACTLDEIIRDNDDLSKDVINSISTLEVGESTFVEITEVKRIS